MKKIILLLFISSLVYGQSTEILPGSVLPKMTTIQRTGMVSPMNGMLVFDTNTQSYWYRNSGTWVQLGSSTISGTTNRVPKYTSGSTLGNSLLFDNGSSVGINTTSPNNGLLHINEVGSYGGIHITNPATGTSVGDGFLVGGRTSNDPDLILWNFENAKIGLGTHGTERLTITGDGKTGIGIISPKSRLHVTGSVREAITIQGLTFPEHSLVVDGGTTNTTNISRGAIIHASNSSIENQALFLMANGIGNSYNVGAFSLVHGSSTGHNYGYYASVSGGSSNYGLYTNAQIYATSGTFGTKPFVIDHPLDPENKVLRHSSIESPDMMNIYNGNITTDNDGYATVVLPHYFEALNEDFKYQLTVIGSFAQAIIKEEVKGNKFVIQTNIPGVKVSWQVSGIRHDAVAKKYPVIVEEDKAKNEKGKYIEPEAFGKAKEAGLHFMKNERDESIKPSQEQIPSGNAKKGKGGIYGEG
jgi:hypothetical protein